MRKLPSKIYLFQGLPKSDKMELIIQKAVELGAYEVIPVVTKRAVVKLDEKKAVKKVLLYYKGKEESYNTLPPFFCFIQDKRLPPSVFCCFSDLSQYQT